MRRAAAGVFDREWVSNCRSGRDPGVVLVLTAALFALDVWETYLAVTLEICEVCASLAGDVDEKNVTPVTSLLSFLFFLYMAWLAIQLIFNNQNIGDMLRLLI